MPTIGCALSFSILMGCTRRRWRNTCGIDWKRRGKVEGKSREGVVSGHFAELERGKHLYVSVGHRVGLDSAEKVVRLVTRWRAGAREADGQDIEEYDQENGGGIVLVSQEYEMVYFW